MRSSMKRNPTQIGLLISTICTIFAACTGSVADGEADAPGATSGGASMSPGMSAGANSAGSGMTPGQPGTAPPPGGATDPGSATAAATGAGSLRLTGLEYLNSLRALFPTAKLPSNTIDTTSSGFSSIGASEESVGPSEVNELFDIAVAVSKQIVADTKTRQALIGCQPASPTDAACARQFVTGFGRLAWRRPLADPEVQRLVKLLTGAAAELGDFWSGVELTLTAFLQSPHFLYRFEMGRPDGRLTGYELAARLSFMLTSTPPAAALLDAAGRGELEPDAPGLRAKVTAMLDEAKTKEGFARFFREWLHLDDLALLNRDGDIPTPTAADPKATTKIYTTSFVADLQTQTLRELSSVVFDENRDFTELMTSKLLLVNQRLAPIYGVPSPSTDAKVFVKTAMPEAQQRVGLLGHASFLTLHAAPKASSPVHRGVAVLGSFLCREIPPPPPDVMPPPPSTQPMTARQQLARHRADARCAGCHALIDPPGLAFENFDQLGRYRDNDRGLPIDASGALDEKAFSGPAAFAELIKSHPDFHGCMVRQLYQYSRGNFDETRAQPRLTALGTKFQQGGFRLKALLVDLITDPLFLTVGGAR